MNPSTINLDSVKVTGVLYSPRMRIKRPKKHTIEQSALCINNVSFGLYGKYEQPAAKQLRAEPETYSLRETAGLHTHPNFHNGFESGEIS